MIRNYSNTVAPTSLSAPLNNSATTFDVASTAGFPAVPFIAAIDRGTPDEEVVLVTAKTATTVTTSRGFDGTAAVAHLSGAAFEHTTAAIEHREANEHINDVLLDQHTQYFNLDRAKVYFPKPYQASSPVVVSNINTGYKQCNSLTIPSATFARKAQFTAKVQANLFDTGVTYDFNIRAAGGGSIISGSGVSTLGAPVPTLVTVSHWVDIAANAAFTVGSFIKRDAGSGGETNADPNFNIITALVVPNV